MRACFAIDLRALAAFRIALGAYVLLDLALRARERRTFYTDDGVLPRDVLAAEFPAFATLSIHAISGAGWVQAALFAVAGAAGIALLVGVGSRFVAGGLAVWYASLFARNPHVLYGADGLLLMGLVLGAFLPLGARWGISAHASDHDSPVVSLAGATLLLQLVVIYLANLPFKLRSELWVRGDAVENVLQLEQYAIVLGPHLVEMRWLLTGFNWGWIALLAVSPLLIASEGRVCTLLVGAFAVAHVGMGLTMFIGLFPLIVLVFLVLYLPAGAWDRLDARVPVLPLRGPDLRWSRSQVRARLRPIGVVVIALVLVVTLGWPALAIVDAQGTAGAVGEEYPYTLFAPNPPTDTAGFGVTVTLADGTERNPGADSPVDSEEVAEGLDTDRSHLWYQFLSEMRWGSDREHAALGTYLCNRGAYEYGPESTGVTVYRVSEPSPVTGGGERRATPIVAAEC